MSTKEGTTVEKIREWLGRARDLGARYLLVLYDETMDQDFPIYIKDVGYLDAWKSGELMKGWAPQYKLMEAYNLTMDIEPQLEEHRAMNW